jgi:hypothetical protein
VGVGVDAAVVVVESLVQVVGAQVSQKHPSNALLVRPAGMRQLGLNRKQVVVVAVVMAAIASSGVVVESSFLSHRRESGFRKACLAPTSA